jgi:hypothetical protein
MPTRYKVTFESLDYVAETGYKHFVYTVHTCLDDRKALVMATKHHTIQHPQSHIHQVVGVEKLEGEEPYKTDIIDRTEY